MKKYKILFFLAMLSVSFFSCNKASDYEASENEKLAAYIATKGITTTPTASGLYYIETLAGTGTKPLTGDKVYVHYTGTLIDGTKFDSSYDRGAPFSFLLGTGKVIKGWDEGIALMKKGGKATLIIPSTLGYGTSQVGSIPAYSTLIFTVELTDVLGVK